MGELKYLKSVKNFIVNNVYDLNISNSTYLFFFIQWELQSIFILSFCEKYSRGDYFSFYYWALYLKV